RRRAGDRGQESLSPAQHGGRGQAPGRLPEDQALHHRPAVRRVAEGAGRPLRRRRHLRPDLSAGLVMTGLVLGDGATVPTPPRNGLGPSNAGSVDVGPRAPSRGSLPGFGLSLGVTLTFLSLVVL